MGTTSLPYNEGVAPRNAPASPPKVFRPVYFYRMICTVDFSVWKLVAASKLTDWRLNTPLVNSAGHLLSLQRVRQYTPQHSVAESSDTAAASEKTAGHRDTGESGWRLHLDSSVFEGSYMRNADFSTGVNATLQSQCFATTRTSLSCLTLPSQEVGSATVTLDAKDRSPSFTATPFFYASPRNLCQLKTSDNDRHGVNSSAIPSSDFSITGLFLNTNTPQEFRSLNRRQLIDQTVAPLLHMLEATRTTLDTNLEQLCSLLLHGTTDHCQCPVHRHSRVIDPTNTDCFPSLLSCTTRFNNFIALCSRFLLICFADLKNHLYYYNVATPALRPKTEFKVISRPLSLCPSGHHCYSSTQNPSGCCSAAFHSDALTGGQLPNVSTVCSETPEFCRCNCLPMGLHYKELEALGKALLFPVEHNHSFLPIGCLGIAIVLKRNRSASFSVSEDPSLTFLSVPETSPKALQRHSDECAWLINVFSFLLDRLPKTGSSAPERQAVVDLTPAKQHNAKFPSSETLPLPSPCTCTPSLSQIIKRAGVRWLSPDCCLLPLWSFFVLYCARQRHLGLSQADCDLPQHTTSYSGMPPLSSPQNTSCCILDDVKDEALLADRNILYQALGFLDEAGKENDQGRHLTSPSSDISAAVCCVDTGENDVLGWPMRSVLYALGYLGLSNGVLPLFLYRDGLQGTKTFHYSPNVRPVTFSRLLYIWMPPASAFLLHSEPALTGDPAASVTSPICRLPIIDGWLRCAAESGAEKPERRGAGSLGFTFTVDLRRHLDPAVSQADAVNLNIQLIRWRILPSFDAARLQHLRFLLVGMGTLGCAIARTLVAWGVTHMSFIDSGRVALSSPVRQILYTHEDATWGGNGGKLKVVAAKERLREIRPDLSLFGFPLEVPMPGHPRFLVPSSTYNLQDTLSLLERLIDSHDIVLLLTDSRESRWLPSLLVASRAFRNSKNISEPLQPTSLSYATGSSLSGTKETLSSARAVNEDEQPTTLRDMIVNCSYSNALFQTPPTFPQPVCITVALGFDSFVVMRHGHRSSAAAEDVERRQPLACYFCNDLAAPADSVAHRPLDEQCTVTRPGVSGLAASIAAELVAALSQHPLAPDPPPECSAPQQSSVNAASASAAPTPESPGSCLGAVPHTIRGNLGTFRLSCTQTDAFEHCICCSEPICKAYCSEDKMRFVEAAIRSSETLEHLSGLAQVKQCCREIEVLCFDNVDSLICDDDFTFC